MLSSMDISEISSSSATGTQRKQRSELGPYLDLDSQEELSLHAARLAQS